MAVSSGRGKWRDLHGAGLLCVLVLCALGVYNLESASVSAAGAYDTMQMVWLGIGWCCCLVVLAFDDRFSRQLAYILYGGVCLALVVVLLQDATTLKKKQVIYPNVISTQLKLELLIQFANIELLVGTDMKLYVKILKIEEIGNIQVKL